MAGSSISSICAVFCSAVWSDLLYTFAPAPADVLFYAKYGSFDDPMGYLCLGLVLAVGGWGYAMNYILSSEILRGVLLGIVVLLIGLFGIRLGTLNLGVLLHVNKKYECLGGSV